MKKIFLSKTLIFSLAFCIFNFLFISYPFLYSAYALLSDYSLEEKSNVYLEDDFNDFGPNMQKWSFFGVTNSYSVTQSGGWLNFILSGGWSGMMNFGVSSKQLYYFSNPVDKEYFYEFDIKLPSFSISDFPYHFPRGGRSITVIVMGPNLTSYTIQFIFDRLKGKYTKTVSFNDNRTTKTLEKIEFQPGSVELPRKIRVSVSQDRVLLDVNNTPYSSNYKSTAAITYFYPWIMSTIGNYLAGTTVSIDNVKTNIPLSSPPNWMTQPDLPNIIGYKLCDNCPASEQVGSEVEIAEGTLSIDHTLSSIKFLNSPQSLSFTYNSLTANPSVSISTELPQSATNTSTLPESLTYQLFIADIFKKVKFSTTLDISKQTFLWDAKSQNGSTLPTGIYPYKLYFTNSYNNDTIRFMTPTVDRTALINNQSSPFGAGWSLDGLEQLKISDNGNALFLKQSGNRGIIYDRTGEMSQTPITLGFTASSLTFDPIKNILYTADTSNDRIYYILSNGTKGTLTGGVKSPASLVVDSQGNVFAAGKSGGNNPKNIIFKIEVDDSQNATTTPFLNTGAAVPVSLAYDQPNSHLYALNSNGSILQMNSNATPTATYSTLVSDIPNPIAISHSQTDGNLYLLQKDRLQNLRILQITPDGKVYPFVTIPNKNADIRSITISPDGNIFTLDYTNNNVLKIDRDGVVITYASITVPQLADAKPIAITINPASTTYELFVSLKAVPPQIRKISQSNIFKPSSEGIFSYIHKNLDSSYTRILKDKTTFNFSPDGLLSSTSDTNGNTWNYNYDADKKLTSIIAPTGKNYSFSYAPSGLLQSITDPAGKTTTFTHDTNGNITAITNPDNTTKSFSYTTTPGGVYTTDAQKYLLTSKTAENGKTTNYNYDNYGRIQSVRYPNNTSKSFSPSAVQGLSNNLPNDTLNPPSLPSPSTVTDANGNITTYKTNKFGNTVEETDALQRTTKTERDENSNPTKIIQPNGLSVFMTYDEQGNILTSTDNFTYATTTYTYDPVFNNITSITDAKGNITRFEYDNKGNLIRTIDALGNSTTNTYNSNGLITSTADAFGKTTFYTYNPDGNLSTITDAEGGVTTYVYNSAGNTASITEAEDRITRFEYDNANRLIKTTSPDNSFTTNEYDAGGNLVLARDQLGRETHFEYDVLNRLTSTTDALGNITTSAYDNNSNLISTTNTIADGSLSRTTTYEYNQVNKLTKTTFSDISTIQNQYDSMDDLVATINQNGKILQYQYDLANRLIKQISPIGAQTSYTYDINGNTETVTDALNRTTTYKYDALNRRIEEINPLGNTRKFSYDVVGNITSLTDENSNTTTYQYDSLNRLTHTIDTLGGDYSKSYDKVGNVTADTDPLGRTTSYEYNNLNRLLRTTDALGNQISYQYDAVGNLIAQTDAKGKTTRYEYDVLNRLTKTIDPLGNERLNSYDAFGNLVSTTGSQGNTTTYEYDKMGHQIKQILPDEKTTSYTYDPAGNLLTTTDANGKITTNAYDDDNRLISVVDPLGYTTTYSQDAVGNTISTTDAKGNTDTNAYDALNRLVKTASANGAETTYEYDAVGNLVKTIDAEGNETLNKYDVLNRLLETTNALDGKESFTYDKVGNQTSRTDENDVTSNFAYDTLNRLTASYLPEGVIISYEYDELGNQTKITNAKGKNTNYTYDDLGRLISETNPLGQTKSYTYDSEGNLLSLTKLDGQIIRFEYDTLGRRTKKILPDGNTKNFTYDTLDNLLSVSNNCSVGAPCDSVGSYAGSGLQPEPTNPVGSSFPTRTTSKIDYEYDDDGRVTKITTSINLDCIDRVNAVCDIQLPTSVLTYSYDPNNNLVSVTDKNGNTVESEYDNMDKLTEIISSSIGVSPVPNTLNPSPSVSSSFPTRTTFTYNKLGLMTNKTTQTGSPNSLGIQTQYTYDTLGRITGIKTLSPSTINDLTYTYDPVGNRLSMAQTAGPRPSAHNYTYDRLYQLTSTQHGSIGVSPVPNGSNSLNFTESYSYDKNYNRVSSHLSSAYSYDDTDRLLEDDNYTYTYDLNGNLTEKLTKSCNTSSGTSVQSASIGEIRVPCERMLLSYDADDHLTHVERYLNNSATASMIANYYYDALDRRIAKEVNGVLTYYEWDNDNLLAEYLCNSPLDGTLTQKSPLERGFRGVLSSDSNDSNDSNGLNCKQVSYYLHPAGSIDAPLSMLRGNFATDTATMGNSTNTHQPSAISHQPIIQHFYYVTDALNSVIQILNDAGQPIVQTTYDSFGNLALDEGFISNPYNFTGRQYDIETGLYYYRARYYDATTGRFLQQDPIFDTNLYVYTINNPLNYTDPLGMYFKLSSPDWPGALGGLQGRELLYVIYTTMETSLGPVEVRIVRMIGSTDNAQRIVITSRGCAWLRKNTLGYRRCEELGKTLQKKGFTCGSFGILTGFGWCSKRVVQSCQGKSIRKKVLSAKELKGKSNNVCPFKYELVPCELCESKLMWCISKEQMERELELCRKKPKKEPPKDPCEYFCNNPTRKFSKEICDNCRKKKGCTTSGTKPTLPVPPLPTPLCVETCSTVWSGVIAGVQGAVVAGYAKYQAVITSWQDGTKCKIDFSCKTYGLGGSIDLMSLWILNGPDCVETFWGKSAGGSVGAGFVGGGITTPTTGSCANKELDISFGFSFSPPQVPFEGEAMRCKTINVECPPTP